MSKRGRKIKPSAASPPLIFYRCPKCKREFNVRQEAVQCEAGHLRVVSAREVQYTVKPYPFTVEVAFNNGEKRIYRAEDLGG
ncbi:MAG: hypothetical protein LBN00_04910 [Oscillospiraceae bacterium]|nr:hypothetical protein [Oscillospiraceae bacterium]